MSHIYQTPIRMDSKDAIRHMCELMPELFTFHDQRTFKAYYTESCDFCISVNGATYQVGFRKQEDGTFMPSVDWLDSKLKTILGGEEMTKLKAAYNAAKVHLEAKNLGYEATLAHLPDGKYKLLVAKEEEVRKSRFQWGRLTSGLAKVGNILTGKG